MVKIQENKMDMEDIHAALASKGVIAVLEIENQQDAVPACKALLDGGISVIELALRTQAAEPSIKIIKTSLPQMMIGAGTLIRKGQAQRIKNLGADFALAPGYNAKIVHEAQKAELPFIPGIATPSELESAVSEGLRVLKFFPAEPIGGISFLKSINYPYSYLDLRYVPLGGVNEENLASYAGVPQVLAVGGTWIAKEEFIKNKQWNKITALARVAMQIWSKNRGKNVR
jgi:2-dehydro-3-deoxyphosphogluconate aldolase/(4S)-4-hydroxy-2-oxoglutarate aldolase